MKNKHENIDYIALLGGLVLFLAGLFWFLSSVTVTTGFYAFRMGSLSISSGLVVVPFLIGVVMLFFDVRSLPGKLLTGAGLVFIVASIIMGTRLIFRPTSLFVYLVMLVLCLGGAVLTLKAVFGGKKGKG